MKTPMFGFEFLEMPKLKLVFITALLLGCSSGIESEFPMEKRYWGASEYDKVIRTLRYHTRKGQRLPEFSNPETAPVIKKLLDSQNFLVVLTDDNLGISHRNEVAEDFFMEYRNMPKVYSEMDRRDKYVYGMELIEVYKFGLHLQLHYFKLGNENIVKNADDPESTRVKRLLKSNSNTIYENYTNYLDYVNNESSFSDGELKIFSEGIDQYFPQLFEMFPEGNRNIIKKKAELMLNKAQNQNLKEALEQLLQLVA